MKRYALIVAGGSGTRMHQQIPKQFIPIGGQPILMHTLQAFASLTEVEIILVLPQEHIAYWKNLCSEYSFAIRHSIVSGGDTRFHSVKNGLDAIEENSLVAVHDGVRPLISAHVIEQAYAKAKVSGNAVVAVKLKDSIREILPEGENLSRNRESFLLIQTPQTFQTRILKQAYDKALHENYTDDAAVLEAADHNIHLVEGEYTNIKITTPEDLMVAEAFIKAKKDSQNL